MRSDFIIGLVAWGVLATAAPAAGSVDFTLTDIAVGTTPVALASGDLNGDGKVDLAAANSDSGDISILYGQGDGTFLDPGATFPTGSAPTAIALGDFNKDGKPDIVVTDDLDGTVAVLLNQGDMVFDFPLTVETNGTPGAVVVGDFNSDGALDVATADEFEDAVVILLGNGDGTFSPGFALSVGTSPLGLVAVDLDHDGNLDLVVANSAGGDEAIGTLTVLKGAGGGTFIALPEIESPLFDGPGPIVAADLDGNGTVDVAVANQGGGGGDFDTVTVLLGDATGDTFQVLSPPLNIGLWPTGMVAADFDGDEKLDLATANNFDDNVSVLLGVGDGTFQTKVDFDVAPFAAPAALVSADFNGDGTPDLATANEDESTVSILLNAGTVQPTVCAGDCDGSGDVTVDELITLVNIALGNAEPSACPDGVPSGRVVDITLIVAAVNNALGACPLASR